MSEQLSLFPVDEGYSAFFGELKTLIRAAQLRAALAANQKMVMLYWQIGCEILTRQKQQEWDAKAIEHLAKDLKRKSPRSKGLSLQNLKYMRAFAEAYPDEQIVQRSVAHLPWRHNIVLLEKLKSTDERLWYAQQALKYGWSWNVLVIQIEIKLYESQDRDIKDFAYPLPAPESDLAKQLVGDSSHLDFLTLELSLQELKLERALVPHVRDFFLNLGIGFTFVGNQHSIAESSNEYPTDLLFYHLKLRCFVIVDLVMAGFNPEYLCKVNSYMAAVDGLMRYPGDTSTIGIVLRRSKDGAIAEYVLPNTHTSMAIATRQLPAQFQGHLPPVEQLEMELATALSGPIQDEQET